MFDSIAPSRLCLMTLQTRHRVPHFTPKRTDFFTDVRSIYPPKTTLLFLSLLSPVAPSNRPTTVNMGRGKKAQNVDPLNNKRQKREDYRAARRAETLAEMPRKKFYRQRAHANPFSDHSLI